MALGRMAGILSIAAAEGDFIIETFQGEIKESDLMQLTFRLVDREAARLKDVALQAELIIRDLTAFAAALNQEVGKVGAVSFSGEFSLSELAPSLLGSVTVDTTQMDVDLRGSLEDGVPRVDGSLKSKTLHLDDIRGLIGLMQIGSTQDIDEIDVSDKLEEAIRARIDLDLEGIAGGDAATKNARQIKGTIEYRDGSLLLDPLTVNYLSGTVITSFHTDMRKSPLSHRIKGRVSKLQMGELLREMQVPQMISGSLTLDYDLAMSGNSVSDALKTTSGSISGSIWGGFLETDLLDLSGLNLITWLGTSSKAKGRAQLVCARLPIQFNNGRGSTRSFIIETKYVQAIGAGSVDLRKNRVNLSFQPRPKVKQVINIVSPFSVVGPLGSPAVKLEKGGVAGRAVAETLALPLNVLGGIFAGKPRQAPGHRACVALSGRSLQERQYVDLGLLLGVKQPGICHRVFGCC